MSVVDTASDLGSKLSDIADNMGEMGRAAARALESRRGDTAATLHGAAATLRSTGDQVREKIDELVNTVADKLENAASYMEGVGSPRRRTATAQVLMAGGIALVVGIAMWRLSRQRPTY